MRVSANPIWVNCKLVHSVFLPDTSTSFDPSKRWLRVLFGPVVA